MASGCNPFNDGCLSRDTPEGACVSASDAALLVVEVSVQLLEPFFCPGGRCDGLVGIVSHDTPPLDQGSMVAAWVESVTPALSESPHLPSYLEASIALQVWIDCWPSGEVDGGRFYPPEPAVMSEAAVLALNLGQTWYVGLSNYLRENAGRCEGWKLDTLTPLDPQGTLVGWETGLRVRL